MASLNATVTATRKSLGVDTYAPIERLDSYHIVGVIGKGSFGVIHKVVRKEDNVVRFVTRCFLGDMANDG
jgi:hypothetical protein